MPDNTSRHAVSRRAGDRRGRFTRGPYTDELAHCAEQARVERGTYQHESPLNSRWPLATPGRAQPM